MANPSWSPLLTVAPYAVIVDSNGNVQQANASGGTTGSTPPAWATVIGGTTTDGSSVPQLVWTVVAVLAVSQPSAIGGLPAPLFVTDADGLDPNLILSDMQSTFQALAGRVLQPAQVEQLLINLYAYRESLVRNAVQYAAQQNLLAFATYPMLDYLGQLLSVTRLPAQAALTTLQFTLTAALTVPFTIPAGTLVGSQDGQTTWTTNSALTIAAGQTTGSVSATCTTAGTIGNGYLAGQINVLLNPNAVISTVDNTNTSGGGSTPETDAHFRARIQAAPNEFSTAGPSAAYKFFAMGVDPSIIDVLVTSPVPGAVDVYILTGPITTQPAASPNSAGIANSTLLTKVLTALSADDIRPLTDTVAALAVTEVDYTIVGTVTLYSDADPVAVAAAVNFEASEYAIGLASRIQRDIVPSEIIAALSVSGVYEVALTDPAYTALTAGQWANATAITLTFVTGTEHS